MTLFFKNLFRIHNKGRKLWISLVFCCISGWAVAQYTFVDQQKNYPRVRSAFERVEDSLKIRFREEGIVFPPKNIYIRVFKEDGSLEIWVKQKLFYSDEPHYVLFDAYDVCKTSGDFGPKVREGDYQVPEGFYYIDRFNPTSDFHLSLGLNYPNEADKRRNAGEIDMGGDIFVHGSCVTVGCVPITDKKIEELYVLAVLAKAHGQERIPIHIFPFRFTVANEHKYYNAYPEHIDFWSNLKFFYHYFELKRLLPDYNIDRVGNYTVSRD